jgi:ABC-type uncharacterized transport system permease subunit
MLADVFHPFSTGAVGGPAMVTLHAAIAGFIAAAMLSLVALFAPARAWMKWANAVGLVATVMLLVYFAARFAEAGIAPLQNLFEVIALSALCVACAYFAVIRAKSFAGLGGFVFPGIALTLLVSFPVAGTVEASSGGAGALTVLHVVFTVLANGVFVIAAISAAMFLIQERALRRHQSPRFVRHFPPLESLRGLLNQCVWIGLPLLTLGLGLGFASSAPSNWTSLIAEPKVFSALVVWAVFAIAAAGRATGWLHGRRHSYLVLAGFVLVILTYAGLGFFVRESSAAQHNALASRRVPWPAM